MPRAAFSSRRGELVRRSTAASLLSEPHTSQYVPLEVWQITDYKYKPRTHRGVRRRKLQSMWSTTNLALVTHELRPEFQESWTLEACSLPGPR
jgi:hypothetical protein